MEILNFLTLMLIAVIAARFLSQKFTKIPNAFLQIGFGLLLSLIPRYANFNLEPALFMLLAVVPILFYEGLHTNARIVSRNFGGIIQLAGTIAIVTMIIVGISVNWVLGWALALLFVLAAIVTPTDATALSSITRNRKMTEGINRALSLESLFNDATGLVVLDMAILTVDTGYFSLGESVSSFLITAFGGTAIGLVIGALVVALRTELLRLQLDDITSHLTIQLLTPFAVYLLAEHWHLSGIIAVVCAGIVHNIERTDRQFASTHLNNTSDSIWRVLVDTLNGVVFVILGLILPNIFRPFYNHGWQIWVLLFGISLFIFLTMCLVRFAMMRFPDSNLNKYVAKGSENKDAFVYAIGGAHGAMNMAMALSVPVVMSNGQLFPHRDELLFIASIVVLLSLIVPTIVLQFILPEKRLSYTHKQYSDANLEMVNHAMAFVNLQDTKPSVKKLVNDLLQSQLGYGPEQLDRQTWMAAYKQYNDTRDKAIEEAIARGELSPEAIKFYRNFSSRRASKTGLSRRHFFVSLVKRMVHHFSDHVRWEHHHLVFSLRRFKESDQVKTTSRRELRNKYRKQLINNMKELNKVADPAVSKMLKDLEAQGADRRLLIALRDASAADTMRLREQVNNAEVSQVFLNALQEELSFVQNARETQKINTELSSVLYHEVTSAQSLIVSDSLILMDED